MLTYRKKCHGDRDSNVERTPTHNHILPMNHCICFTEVKMTDTREEANTFFHQGGQ